MLSAVRGWLAALRGDFWERAAAPKLRSLWHWLCFRFCSGVSPELGVHWPCHLEVDYRTRARR